MEPHYAFSSLLPIVPTSLLKSLQIISFSPAAWFYFRFLLCQLLLCYFPAFQLSQLSASKLFECAVYSQWKNSKQLLDSLSPAVCCLFYFIELLLLVSLKMIHWESLCRRISEPVLHPRFQDYELSENSGACTSLSLNFMCGISPSTQGRAFPHNKAALFFHLFRLWSSIPVLSVAGVWPQALWPPHPAAFTFCFLILLN